MGAGHRRFFLLSAFLLLISILKLSAVSVGGDVVSLIAQEHAEPRSQQSQELVMGQIVERELKGGETHSYKIRLLAGRYLQVVVDQQGIDVVVKLFAPDGNPITEVYGTTASQGEFSYSLIAESPGDYGLEVRPYEKDSVPGRYKMRIAELREATPTDRRYTAAERVTEQAAQLRLQGTGQSLQNALEKEILSNVVFEPDPERIPFVAI